MTRLSARVAVTTGNPGSSSQLAKTVLRVTFSGKSVVAVFAARAVTRSEGTVVALALKTKEAQFVKINSKKQKHNSNR